MRAWLCLFCSLFSAAGLLAQEAQEAPSLRVEILPPPLEGTVSLGVFDATGKCVRVLAKNAAQETMPAALNGWAISWDGKTDAGNTAPAGTYEIRGYVVGEVKIESVTWHFNDWLDPDHPQAAPVRTEKIELLPDGGFVTVQRGLHGAVSLRRYAADGGLLWSQPVHLEPRLFAVRGDMAWVCDGHRVEQFKTADGAPEMWTRDLSGAGSVVAGTDALIFAKGQDLFRISQSMQAEEKIGSLPITPRYLAAVGATIYAADAAKVFRWENGQATEIPLQTEGEITSIVSGADANFWVTVSNSGSGELHCYDSKGHFIRQLEPATIWNPMLVSVADDDRQIALVSRHDSAEQLRVLRLKEATDLTSFWSTVLQREITPCANYGFDEKGALIAETQTTPPNTLETTLLENPLTPGTRQNLLLRVIADSDGVWLVTREGLPLLPVAAAQADRPALLPGAETGSARIYFHQGPAVAEFAVSGLPNIMPCTSGPVQWPPGPVLGPDENDVPTDGPAPTPE